MSFKVAQMRKGQFEKYLTEVKFSSPQYYFVENGGLNFEDVKIVVMDGLTSNTSYHLVFTVKKLSNKEQRFTVKLKNSDNTQILKTFKAPADVSEGLATFELVFTPNSVYTDVCFEMQRDQSDIISSRKMVLGIEAFDIINNVVSGYLASAYGLTTLKKIGIQSSPGLLLTINGEEIRVGKSGIYEIYNENIIISYLGFVPKDDESFILDFKY